MGLGSFLLQMVQMQAVAQGFSSEIYLQANKSTEAAQFYLHRGFVMMKENDPKLLPETLNRLYFQSKDDNVAAPFLYFVTNEQQIQDAIQNQEDPNAPEIQRQCLHLHVLKGLLTHLRSSKSRFVFFLLAKLLLKAESCKIKQKNLCVYTH